MKLVVYPEGSLPNRMLATASALRLAELHQLDLEIRWQVTPDCPAEAKALFGGALPFVSGDGDFETEPVDLARRSIRRLPEFDQDICLVQANDVFFHQQDADRLNEVCALRPWLEQLKPSTRLQKLSQPIGAFCLDAIGAVPTSERTTTGVAKNDGRPVFVFGSSPSLTQSIVSYIAAAKVPTCSLPAINDKAKRTASVWRPGEMLVGIWALGWTLKMFVDDPVHPLVRVVRILQAR